jgi:hypothetical protein
MSSRPIALALSAAAVLGKSSAPMRSFNLARKKA